MRKREEKDKGGGILESLWKYGNLVVDSTEFIKILPAPTCMVLFFFLRRYNFREVLAFSTNSFHLGRFMMQSLQSVIFIFVILLFTSSSHLFLGLPSDLVSAGDHSYTFFTMLFSGIRCTCPNHASLCALM